MRLLGLFNALQLEDVPEAEQLRLLDQLRDEPGYHPDTPRSTFDPLSDPLNDPFPEEFR